MDFSKWDERPYVVTGLHLDPRNPRIPDTDKALTQRQLIAQLVEHDKVYEMAKSIAESGYFPVESLVGVEEDGKRYIVEGNRRLAALKLLISPDMAPDAKTAKRFKRLSEHVAAADIKKVRVVIAPSRAAASVYIKNKHTQFNFERWSRVMQARFYRSLLDEGMSVEDVARDYGSTPSEVAKFMQAHEMYRVACSLDLPEHVADAVRNPREFPMTNLERLYNYPGVTKFLGVSFDRNGRLKGKVSSEEFKKGYSRIVSDVALGNIDSRSHNTTDQIDDYLESIGEEAPNLKRKGSFTAKTIINESEEEKSYESKSVPLPKKKKVVRKSLYLVPKALKSELGEKRIDEVLDELQRLSVEKFRNSVSVLLRLLLELCVGSYLDRTGKIDEIIKKANKKSRKPKDWYPSLRQMLNHIANDDPDFKVHPLALKALKQLTAKDNTLLTVETLDSFVHNKYSFPTEKELRSLWSQLEEVFKVLLAKPQEES